MVGMHSDHVVLAQGRRPGGQSLPWLVHGTSALPLRNLHGRPQFAAARSVTSLLADWPAHAPALQAVTTSADTARLIDSDGIEVRSLELEAPVRPGQLFCTIGNYRRQVIQAAEDAAGDAGDSSARQARSDAEAGVALRRARGEPYVCLTSPARVTGPTATVHIDDPTLDWEVEIAAVLGAAGRYVDSGAADGLIAGS